MTPFCRRASALAGFCLLALSSTAQLNPQTVVTLRPVNLTALEPDQPEGRGTPAEFRVDAWPPPVTALTVILHLDAGSIPAAGPASAGLAGDGPGLHTTGPAPRWVVEGLHNISQPGTPALYGYLPPGSTSFPVRVWLPYDETPQPDRQLEFILRSFASYTLGETSRLTVKLRETPPLNRQPQARWTSVPGTVSPGEPLTFAGEAWDPDGVVTRLDFYHVTHHVGWLLLPAHAPGRTPAFQWRWDDPPPGSGWLTVIPTDERGRSGVPAHAGFRVTPRFVVEADPPGVLNAPAAVTVRLHTEPEMDGFANVSFTIQGEKRRVSGPPFAAAFTLTNAGVHEVVTEGLWRNQPFTAPRLRIEVGGPDAPPLVELEPISTVVREGGTNELVLVFRRRGGDLAAPLTVPLLLARPADDSLPPPRQPTPPVLEPADLQNPLPAEIVFPPGQTEVIWRSAAVDNAAAEGSRGRWVALDPPAGVNRGRVDSARLLVLDDDVPEAGPVELLLNGPPEEMLPLRPLEITARFAGGVPVRKGLLRLDGRLLPGRDTWTLNPSSLFPGPHRAEVEVVDAWMRRGQAVLEFRLELRVMLQRVATYRTEGWKFLELSVRPFYPWRQRLELGDDLVHWRQPVGEEVIPYHSGIYFVPFDPRVKPHGFVRAVSEVTGPGAPPR